jgi:NADH dehydrogenase FAD-containing subunit
VGLRKQKGVRVNPKIDLKCFFPYFLTLSFVVVNFLNLGLLAYVGGGKALSQVELGNMPIFRYAGSISYVLWRSVYLVKQVATRNRILVTFDWLKTYLFGRDITRL